MNSSASRANTEQILTAKPCLTVSEGKTDSEVADIARVYKFSNLYTDIMFIRSQTVYLNYLQTPELTSIFIYTDPFTANPNVALHFAILV